jgi:hypothetical protein
MAQPNRLRREQELHRRAAWQRPVTLRLADDTDDAALDRLAQLDSRHLPPGPHLLAERDGRIEAAICLATGDLVADPFRRTAELCELLRCHAGGDRLRRERSIAPLAPSPKLWVRGCSEALAGEQPV